MHHPVRCPLLVAPAILFLIQVVFIVPPVVLLAGLGFMLKKIATGGFGLDNLTFLAFLLLHLAPTLPIFSFALNGYPTSQSAKAPITTSPQRRAN